MRAYFAILKDSFREALASRVLLISLSGIVVVLLLLSPFGLSTDKATELRRSELTRPEQLLERLLSADVKAADDSPVASTPERHLWSLLNEKQREQMRKILNPDPNEMQNQSGRRGPHGSPLKRQVVEQVNQLLARDDFYDADSWQDVRLSEEAEELLVKAELTEVELKRRNLLLLAAAFRREIIITDSTAISLKYATANVVGPIPLTRDQFEPIFDRIVVEVVAVFLGFFGILGTLLVTAGIIPRTFEPGEIALLLSKPVRRSWLFVTKFLGGCIFTLLYATVLVVGIWLLLGLRMNAWQHRLLWCIPVYVFLFMIYYSVSAVAGAVWRNSIVALSLVVLFWLGLTVVGVTHEALQKNLLREHGIKEITVAGDDIFAVNGVQEVFVWNGDSWEETFEEPPNRMSGFTRRFLSSGVRFLPVYDAANDRLLALQTAASRFGGMGAPQLVAGPAAEDWERSALERIPDVVPAILIDQTGRVLLPAADRIFEYIGRASDKPAGGGLLGSLTGGLLGGGSKTFRQVQPDNMPELGKNFGSAIDAFTSDLLLYGKGTLHRLRRKEDGRYAIARSRDLETEKSAVIAAGGQHVLLGLGDGRVLTLNMETLETVHELQLDEGVLPRVCVAADDGSSLAILTHAETVIIIDGATGRPLNWQPAESGQCSAVAYNSDGKLLVSDGRLAIREYDVPTQQQTNEWAQPTTWVYQFYDYVVEPSWSILPKPSQLDQFVKYLMSGESSVLVNENNGPPGSIDRGSLQQERDVFDPYQVIRDNAIFVVVMLSIGCLYVSRKDY